MSGGENMADDRITALERLTLVQNETLQLLVDHVRALSLVSAALIGTLDAEGRATVREAALASLGDADEAAGTRALVVALTQDPLTASVDRQRPSTDAWAMPAARLQ